MNGDIDDKDETDFDDEAHSVEDAHSDEDAHLDEETDPGEEADPGEDTIAESISDGDIAVDPDVDNVGDLSVEINVEELVAKIESEDTDEAKHTRGVRGKLEKIREERDEELDSTYNFNIDDDV